MIYVLFGPPGVGKTYVGRLISEKIGVPFFDADVLYDEVTKEKLKNGSYSQQDRDVFVSRLESHVGDLSKDSDLVLAEAFTKQKNRIEFKNIFSDSIFIFVVAPKSLARKRMFDRLKIEEHVIGKQNFDKLWDEYDLPEVDHEVINNSNVNDDILLSRFAKICKNVSTKLC